MRILVITRNAWDETNAIGNTLSNFFAGIDDVEFANIYFRSASPKNKLCRNYYRVTETEVIKRWFLPKKIGKTFSYNIDSVPKCQTSVQKSESAAVRFIRNHNLRIAYWLSDSIWYSKRWQNENLSRFIESFKPDMAVTFVKSAPQYYLTVKYLRENFNIPVLSWIADDEYTGLNKKKANREIRNLKYILDESAVVKGCSQEICNYYHSVFRCEASPLYKACDLSSAVKDFVNIPLKLVYAGNLLYGRMDTIKRIVQALELYDPTGEKVLFEVYSNTSLSYDEKKFFDEKISTHFMGCLDYEIIKDRLSSADVVLHAESFEEEQILKTKYSFSTKIIDCLQSGSVLLAVGPCELASISYIKKIPGAYVIDCQNNLETEVVRFLEDRENFIRRALAIRDFALNHHNLETNAKTLKNIFNKVTGEEQ